MIVTFDRSSVDIDRWRDLKEMWIRNPNYTNAEDWYRRMLGKFENVPIKIKGYLRVEHHGTITQVLDVKTVDGKRSVNLDEAWFDPNNVKAFKSITQSEELKDEIKKNPAKVAKNVAMGELKAVPGAVDYNKTEESFGKGRRKTRRGRKGRRRTTRKH